MNPSRDEVVAKALELGFVAAGVAHLGASEHGEALDAWLARGYGGTMRYLHRQARKRRQPALIEPAARAAVVVLENYAAPVASRGPLKVAQYARGTDYHRTLGARLEVLAAWLRGRGAGVARVFVDAGPVPERELAARAGLGWIGKNTMLIRPGAGSLCFIGSVFTDLPLEGSDPADTDRCGSCTRCLDACPTEAFVGPRTLDATRCISYLTIEHKGPTPPELAAKVEGWIFGCDICNEVCPWNVRFAVPTTRPEYHDRGAVPSDDPEFFERMDQAEFVARFADSPLERPGLLGLRRNVRAAAGRAPLPPSPAKP